MTSGEGGQNRNPPPRLDMEWSRRGVKSEDRSTGIQVRCRSPFTIKNPFQLFVPDKKNAPGLVANPRPRPETYGISSSHTASNAVGTVELSDSSRAGGVYFSEACATLPCVRLHDSDHTYDVEGSCRGFGAADKYLEW